MCPIVELECSKCKKVVEKLLSNDVLVKHELKCDSCGGDCIKLISASSVHFKGTGFYATDYKKRS